MSDDIRKSTTAVSDLRPIVPCTAKACPVKTRSRCTRCGQPFCDIHLFKPANPIVAGHRILNCKGCAKATFDEEFMSTVQAALSLLFGLGLAGVTLHSPNGASTRYDCPDVEAAIDAAERTIV